MMQTLPIKKFNEMMTRRWKEACNKWDYSRGLDGYPHLGAYIYDKNYGYVTFDLDRHSSCWRKTKKESIEAFVKMIMIGTGYK